MLVRIELTIDRSKGPSSCWIWTGMRDKDGYGRVSLRPKNLLMHRWMWEQANNRGVPLGQQVCHHCDNPSCVNPAHLFLGTSQDNKTDSVTKGRAVKGERTASAKLTPEAVALIRATKGALKPLAARLGIHWATAYRIRRRESWSHL
jgi:hypothetical protein